MTTPAADVTVVGSVDALRAHAAAYDDLAEALAAPASMRWAAIEPWLRHHPTTRPLMVLVHRDDRLVAAAPLAIGSSRLGPVIGKAGVPGEPFGFLYADPATGEELAGAVAGAVVRNRRRWRLTLTDLPADDLAVDGLAQRLGQVRRSEEAVTPQLDVGPDADARARPSRNTRQADAKARNRIAREGHYLEVRWTSDAVEIEELLPGLVDLHVRRNENLRRTAQLRVPSQRALFTDTVAGHAEDRRVRLLLTRIDGQLAAFALCLVSGPCWWVYANYADPGWLRYSPGTITNAEVVRAAYADRDVHVLDWGSGVQRYKLSGGADLDPRQTLVAESSLLVRALRGAARRLRATRVARPPEPVAEE